jgi:2-methylcitrate dehydratase PrpD
VVDAWEFSLGPLDEPGEKMSVTEQVAAFAVHTVNEDMPSQPYARARDTILDGFGCALVGSPTSGGGSSYPMCLVAAKNVLS